MGSQLFVAFCIIDWKKGSRMNGISLKGFFFRAANTLEVMLSQKEILEDGHNWKRLHQILFF